MNRRRTLESNNYLLKTIDFKSLRKAKGQSDVQNLFEIVKGKDSQFKLLKSSNAFLNIFMLSYLLNCQETNEISNLYSISDDLKIHNVGKQFATFQNDKTLQQLFELIHSKFKNQTNLQELLNQYPIVVFVLQWCSRKIIKNYMEETKDLDLFGNQDQILSDFQTEVRGNLLHFLACSLQIQVTICYSSGMKDEQIIQVHGKKKFFKKVYIIEENANFLFILNNTEEEDQIVSPKELKNHLILKKSKQIQGDREKSKNKDQSVLRDRIESKSLNKDHGYKCHICGSKVKFCECEQKLKTNSRVQNLKGEKTIFSGLGIDKLTPSVRRRQQRYCNTCNRIVCMCKNG